MALPDNTYSSVPVASLLVPPDDKVTRALVDYEKGGVALNDPSQGLSVKTWRIYLQGNDKIYVQAEQEPPILVFNAWWVSELTLCFDQNMRPTIGYVQEGVLKLRWYDTQIQAFRISEFGTSNKNPKLSLDDKRLEMGDRSDIIFAYIRDGSLYYRQQRDRFNVERLLRSGLQDFIVLKNIGMGLNWRMHFELAAGKNGI